jgi:hypothetical protein
MHEMEACGHFWREGKISSAPGKFQSGNKRELSKKTAQLGGFLGLIGR